MEPKNTLSSNPLKPLETAAEPTLKEHSRKKVIGIIAIVLVLLGMVIFFLKLPMKGSSTISNSAMRTNTTVANPENIPFKEMTVPYLRSREYKSTLGEREVYAGNGSYTSYVTSYSSDGLTINGLLTIPTGEKPTAGWPAIVFIHGYIPPNQYVTTEKYVDYIDYLARNGFVVFKIDLRGHGNSDGESGGGYYGSDYIVDTLNAYAALETSGFVNPQAIGLWGHSMAGNVILRSMAAKPTIPGSVIWAGAVYTYLDQRKYGIQDASYQPQPSDTQRQTRRRELFEKHGTPSAESSFWQQVAATNYLNDLKGAIEIHHAVDDDVVDIGYSRDLMTLLDDTSVPHQLFEYQSGGHNIQDASFVSAMERTVAFFKEHLK